MRIDDITEERLLQHPRIRKVFHDFRYWFGVEDLNREFEGAFRMLPELTLNAKGGDHLIPMQFISIDSVLERRDEYIPLNEFDRSLKTMWRYRK